MKKKIIALTSVLVVVVSLSQISFVKNIAIFITYNLTKQTELTVKGKTLFMNGLINRKTPDQLKKIFAEHSNIDTLVMMRVPGSVDDDANLRAAKWVSKKQLIFVLEPESMIASGGTDFFLAGKKRIIKKGAQIGVHSWAGEDKAATDFAKGHEYHQPYINYYISIGWSRIAAEKFYYYTINAAPADDIYWMTDQELLEYHVCTTLIHSVTIGDVTHKTTTSVSNKSF